MEDNQRMSNKLSKMEKIVLSLASLSFSAGGIGGYMLLYASHLDHKDGVKSKANFFDYSYEGDHSQLHNTGMVLAVSGILLGGALGFYHVKRNKAETS